MLWAPASPGDLIFRAWSDEGEAVLFNPVSGDTHLVDDLGIELLRLLQQEPQEVVTLAGKLSVFFQDVDSVGIADHVDATLRSFQHLGIVVSSAP